jgi:hypothetical protein
VRFAIILTAAPGAGKSTVTESLAARFERAADIPGCLVARMDVCSGAEAPTLVGTGESPLVLRSTAVHGPFRTTGIGLRSNRPPPLAGLQSPP